MSFFKEGITAQKTLLFGWGKADMPRFPRHCPLKGIVSPWAGSLKFLFPSLFFIYRLPVNLTKWQTQVALLKIWFKSFLICLLLKSFIFWFFLLNFAIWLYFRYKAITFMWRSIYSLTWIFDEVRASQFPFQEEKRHHWRKHISNPVDEDSHSRAA